MPRSDHDTDARSRLRHNRLWILAALLGAATVYSFTSIIHDTTQRHIAASLVRKATAERISSFAAERVQVLALETFAPVLAEGARSNGRAVLDALVKRQVDAVRCACRDTLPVRAFYRVDAATNAFEVAAPPGAARASLSANELAAVAQHDVARARRRPAVHLTADRTLGDLATVTYVQHDTAGAAVAVYGLVADRHDLGKALFEDADRSTTIVELGARMATLDSTSLLVAGQDSLPMFGAITYDGRFAATIYPQGPLEGLTVAVALGGWQIHPSLLTLIPQRQLWHNGLLILSTVLAMIFAIGSTRREALLARARSDFIAGVSHDLRMPLAQILLASETLVVRRDAGERERLGLGNTILREARRLVALVENVLLFSRSGSVELKARLEPVMVDDLFADAIEAVALAADDARQSIDAHTSPSLAVLGDRQLVRQALVNLIDNALKYGKAGQCIQLSAERMSATTVRLYVDDRGPGIAASERERVFEPYERLAKDQASERTGSGLGLAVTRQIARACGGRVWLEGGPDGGTRAVIELSAARVPAPATRATEPV